MKEHDILGVSARNPKRNTQTGCEIRLEGQQLLTNNMFVYDAENPDDRDEKRNLLLACVLRTIAGKRKKMPLKVNRKKLSTSHRSGRRQNIQDKPQNITMAWIDKKMTYDMAPRK